MVKNWQIAQEWERNWHGNCVNSLNEEQKQIIYAEKMGLTLFPTPKTPYSYNLKGKSILDIGSGPYSLLLKCVNFKNSAVVDPLMDSFPYWVIQRYQYIDLETLNIAGEELHKSALNKAGTVFDEVWIYNVLQHTYDPKKIMRNALGLGRVVRVFEWLDTPSNIGHPQTLTEKDLNKWLRGEGKAEEISRSGAVGKCYYGVFKGKHYESSKIH